MWYHFRPPLPVVLMAMYVGLGWYSLHKSSSPQRSCTDGTECFHPAIAPKMHLEMQLWLFQQDYSSQWSWTPIETCHINFTVPEVGFLPTEITKPLVEETSNVTSSCTAALPDSARIRRSSKRNEKAGLPVQAKFRLKKFYYFGGQQRRLFLADVPFTLTRIVQRPAGSWTAPYSEPLRPRKLLEISKKNSTIQDGSNEDYSADFVPFLKYGSQPLVIRFVGDYRLYGGPPPLYRGDGTVLSIPVWNQTAFVPPIYADEVGLMHSSQREIAANGTNRPPIQLRIKVSTLSPMWDAMNLQVSSAMEFAETVLSGGELDELRYFLRDERLFRFFWSQAISFLHVWLDYLAFRDEVRFYRGRTDLSGVSVSSVVSRLLCSLIIFLYLQDSGGTSWVILLGVLSSISVDAWKVWKLLRPSFSVAFPFVKVRQVHSSKELETATYDKIAVRFLCFLLYPTVVIWSVYALFNSSYQSWYSWFISNLANAVYMFGFIALCPQLYVNYRLKSVAHLPWKVFLYKMFNTFVDDFFAWMIEMPWKHRIMTLRDDVVFAIFIVQAYVYRVDRTRTNEFGYAYEASVVNELAENDETPGSIQPKEKVF